MRLSASKMSLAKHCLYWARPDVELPVSQSSAAADAGTGKHKTLELLPSGTLSHDEFCELWGCHRDDVASVLENINSWLRPWLDGSVWPNVEHALAYNARYDMARALKGEKARDYSGLLDDEIPMTIDFCAIVDKGVGLVVDYKTGRQDGLDPVTDSAQLNLCALAFARENGLDEVRIAYALVGEDGHARIEQHTLDCFDLAAIAEDVRDTLDRLKANPKPCPGEHCRTKWYSAKRVCPATIGLAKATPEFAPLVVRIDSAEQCARVHSQIALAEEFLASVKAAIKDYVAANGSVALDDGSTLELVQKSRETLDIDGNEKAVQALRLALGSAFDRAVHSKVIASKESIKAATAQLAKGKERTALERAIIEELQTLNAVKLSTFETVEVVRNRTRKAG